MLFLLIGFVVMDGFDLGVGMLLPVVAKDDEERRVLLNSVARCGRATRWAHRRCRHLVRRLALVYAASFSALYRALHVPAVRPLPAPGRFRLSQQAAGALRRRWWGPGPGGWRPAADPGVWRDPGLCCKACCFASIRPFASTTAPSEFHWPLLLTCMGTALALLMLHGASFLQCKTQG